MVQLRPPVKAVNVILLWSSAYPRNCTKTSPNWWEFD